ncbi:MULTISPECIES: LysE family translocator [unclassified Marinobacter]|uniref:LysE family translocator n=1 Tax=unclassified Marinobacter TaxID=83889 RepID=UPI001908CB53|nr:LysE family translocator [Marinobacter sp. 1-4A]MBK1852322.1 LysE family translocator [Marinobacter sp. 1-4A]
MSFALLLPMAAFALAASISPGPVNLVCLSSGTRYRLRQGFWFVSGATLGFIALFLAIGLGLHSALVWIPGFDRLLTWAGIAFLLYLSYRLATDDGKISDKALGNAPGFWTGAAMQWLNPKAWFASASGIGAYTSGGDLIQLAVFSSLYLPICWLSLSTWVLAGRFLRQYVQRPGLLRTVNCVLAALLLISCLYLILGQDAALAVGYIDPASQQPTV